MQPGGANIMTPTSSRHTLAVAGIRFRFGSDAISMRGGFYTSSSEIGTGWSAGARKVKLGLVFIARCDRNSSGERPTSCLKTRWKWFVVLNPLTLATSATLFSVFVRWRFGGFDPQAVDVVDDVLAIDAFEYAGEVLAVHAEGIAQLAHAGEGLDVGKYVAADSAGEGRGGRFRAPLRV